MGRFTPAIQCVKESELALNSERSERRNSLLEQKVSHAIVEASRVEQFVNQWMETSEEWTRCSSEHQAAVLPCIMYLCNVFTGQELCSPFSLIVQGAGGTGKTHSVIACLKSFLDAMVGEFHDDRLKETVLFLGPTNVVATAIGGYTIDSGLFNRRRPDQGAQCSSLVKLVIIDEFSMVSLSWIAKIDAALKDLTQNMGAPFGSLSMVFIGDVHQLTPVLGTSVYSSVQKLKLGTDDWKGSTLWRGDWWRDGERNVENRANLGITMVDQYRMDDELAILSETLQMVH